LKPWFERDPDRYKAEREFWLGHGFTESRGGEKLVFRGVVTLTVSKAAGEPYEKHEFDLTVTYLEGFPYVAPEVAFIEPSIRRHRHQSPRGKPCLFPDDAWHSDKKPDEFLKALRSWLQAYVVGAFRNELAIYELPEYMDPSGLTVLGPPGMDDAAERHDSGDFRITELVGVDLAVVTHLQGIDVGTQMLAGLKVSPAIKQQERVGTWYRLTSEPDPPRLVTEVTDILAASGHENVVLPPRPRPRLIAFRFEDEVRHQARWLFLDTGVENHKRPPRPAERKVLGANFHPVSREELFRRLQGVTDTDTLAEREVAVFGLGAIGSHATLALAREGVGEFTLCDPDFLRPGNVVRHALDLSAVGQLKAPAMEAAVRRINPFVETSIQMRDLRNPAALDELMSTAHLVISAIGDDTVEEQLNEVVVESLSKPAVLYARTLHAGDAIRIALFRPGRDPCFTCLMLHREDDHPDWVTVPASDLPPVHDDGCAAPAPVGAGLASQHAGLLITQRAVDVLTTGGRDENHWLWLERPIADIQARRMPEPGVLRADRFDPHPDCPVCAHG
jgi:molybdopterin/thiamine biosynthesis adenylyltransferase